MTIRFNIILYINKIFVFHCLGDCNKKTSDITYTFEQQTYLPKISTTYKIYYFPNLKDKNVHCSSNVKTYLSKNYIIVNRQNRVDCIIIVYIWF